MYEPDVCEKSRVTTTLSVLRHWCQASRIQCCGMGLNLTGRNMFTTAGGVTLHDARWHHWRHKRSHVPFFRRLFDHLPVQISTSDLHQKFYQIRAYDLECSFPSMKTLTMELQLWLMPDSKSPDIVFGTSQKAEKLVTSESKYVSANVSSLLDALWRLGFSFPFSKVFFSSVSEIQCNQPMKSIPTELFNFMCVCVCFRSAQFAGQTATDGEEW